jgi:oxygen-dependent protoporphyrinogen oxidase
MQRVVIVGAGVSGLALAYRLRSLCDAETVVLESASRPGGAVWTESVDGFVVEHGPNGVLDAPPSTVELARELGVGDRLIAGSPAARKHRFLNLNGQLLPLPGDLRSFLRSPLLSARGKLRIVAELCVHRGPGRPESVAAFARRRFGREAADVLFDAITTGIHGGDPLLLDVRAAFPRLVRLEAESGSVIRGVLRTKGPSRQMWSFPRGLRELVDALAEATRPCLGVAVRRIERSPTGWCVVAQGRDAWHASAVVLTCPAYDQAAILADLDPPLADDIAGIPYNRIAVVALGFRAADVPRRPAGFGFIAPQRTRRDLLGVQWCSEIYPGRAPDGMVLWRALCGGWHRADVADWPDGELIAAVGAELKLLHGVTAAPVFVRIVRWPRAIPQYLVGHPERVGRILSRAAKHPGLFLAGNAYSGVAVNDCTAQARPLARRVAAYLAAAYDGPHHA